jgi:hypothetical protein
MEIYDNTRNYKPIQKFRSFPMDILEASPSQSRLENGNEEAFVSCNWLAFYAETDIRSWFYPDRKRRRITPD